MLYLANHKIIPVVCEVEFDSKMLYHDLLVSEKLGNMPVTHEIEIQSYKSLKNIMPRTIIDPKLVNNTTTNTNKNDRNTLDIGLNHDSNANINKNTTTTEVNAFNNDHDYNNTNNDLMEDFSSVVPVEEPSPILDINVPGTSKTKIIKRKLPFFEHSFTR